MCNEEKKKSNALMAGKCVGSKLKFWPVQLPSTSDITAIDK